MFCKGNDCRIYGTEEMKFFSYNRTYMLMAFITIKFKLFVQTFGYQMDSFIYISILIPT